MFLDATPVRLKEPKYQAALAITGTWQGSNRSKLYEELGCKRILQIHKIKNNTTPPYLRGNLPPIRGTLYRNNNPKYIREIRCKAPRYKNSVLPDDINSWSNIITDFQGMSSIDRLKAHILSLIRPKIRTTFGVHDPLGVRYIFQLRMNLSPLRNHKKTPQFC